MVRQNDMTEQELLDFERALSKAEQAAQKYNDTEDGGSCNFDTPIVRLNATRKQLASLDWVVEEIGNHLHKGWYFVGIKLSGQGNRRTRMAEAAAKSLKESGYEASVFYMVD